MDLPEIKKGEYITLLEKVIQIANFSVPVKIRDEKTGKVEEVKYTLKGLIGSIDGNTKIVVSSSIDKEISTTLESLVKNSKIISEIIKESQTGQYTHDQLHERILDNIIFETSLVRVFRFLKFNIDDLMALTKKIIEIVRSKNWNPEVLIEIFKLLTEENIFYRRDDFFDFIADFTLESDSQFEPKKIRRSFIATFPKRHYYRAIILNRDESKSIVEKIREYGILPYSLRKPDKIFVAPDFLSGTFSSPEAHFNFSSGKTALTSWTESPILSASIVEQIRNRGHRLMNSVQNPILVVIDIVINSFYAMDFIPCSSYTEDLEDTTRQIQVLSNMDSDPLYKKIIPKDGSTMEVLFKMKIEPKNISSIKILNPKRSLIYSDNPLQ